MGKEADLSVENNQSRIDYTHTHTQLNFSVCVCPLGLQGTPLYLALASPTMFWALLKME